MLLAYFVRISCTACHQSYTVGSRVYSATKGLCACAQNARWHETGPIWPVRLGLGQIFLMLTLTSQVVRPGSLNHKMTLSTFHMPHASANQTLIKTRKYHIVVWGSHGYKKQKKLVSLTRNTTCAVGKLRYQLRATWCQEGGWLGLAVIPHYTRSSSQQYSAASKRQMLY